MTSVLHEGNTHLGTHHDYWLLAVRLKKKTYSTKRQIIRWVDSVINLHWQNLDKNKKGKQVFIVCNFYFLVTTTSGFLIVYTNIGTCFCLHLDFHSYWPSSSVGLKYLLGISSLIIYIVTRRLWTLYSRSFSKHIYDCTTIAPNRRLFRVDTIQTCVTPQF